MTEKSEKYPNIVTSLYKLTRISCVHDRNFDLTLSKFMLIILANRKCLPCRFSKCKGVLRSLLYSCLYHLHQEKRVTSKSGAMMKRELT